MGSALKKMITLLLLPFYARALSPAEYGVLETLGTMVFFISVVLNVGLDSATGLFFYQAKTDEEKGKLLYTLFILRMLTFIPIFISLFFAAGISRLLFNNDLYSWSIIISLVSIPFILLTSEQERIFRLYRKPWKFNIITIIKSLLGIGLGILLVIYLNKGVAGAQMASLLSSVVIVILAFFWFSGKKYTYHFSWEWARQMLKYGYPIIFAGLGQWVFNASDRFFLLYYKDLDHIGYYSIGNTFSQPLQLINMAIQMSFSIMFYSMFNNENDPEKPRSRQFAINVFNITLCIGILITLFLSVFGLDLIKLITTPKYAAGAIAVPFLSFSILCSLLFQISAVGIEISKKSYHFTWLIAVSAAVNFGINFYFIPRFGVFGASFTTFFANFIYLALALLVAQRYFKIPYKYFSHIGYFGFSLLLCLAVPILEQKYMLHISFIVKSCILLSGIVLPFVFTIFHYRDVKTGFAALRNIF